MAGPAAAASTRLAEAARNKLLRRNLRIPVWSTLSRVRGQTDAWFSEKIQPNQVIPGREKHQPQHQNQPKPKSNVLGPLVQRPPRNSFHSIVQKMAPVEERNRKKVGQADAYRKDSHKIEERQKANIRHL